MKYAVSTAIISAFIYINAVLIHTDHASQLRILSISTAHRCRKITLFCLLWSCLKRLNSMSREWFQLYLYSRLHQLPSQSYSRAQWEKTAWCKHCMSLELEARPHPLWQKQDFTALGLFYHVNRVRELWADMAVVSVTDIWAGLQSSTGLWFTASEKWWVNILLKACRMQLVTAVTGCKTQLLTNHTFLWKLK